MKKAASSGILFTILAAVLLMALFEGIFRPDYAVKSAVKAVLFFALPLVWLRFHKEQSLKRIFALRLRKLPIFFAIGLGVYAVILVIYLVFGRFFDLSGITQSLEANIGVNESNFVFVALYISFVNSFLEEFFFRGFSFLILKNLTGLKFAYLFSAAVFSIYHITMMIGWFSVPLLLLIITSLFIAGLFFNFLDSKTDNLYASFAVHIFANLAINTIGFILFGLI